MAVAKICASKCTILFNKQTVERRATRHLTPGDERQAITKKYSSLIEFKSQASHHQWRMPREICASIITTTQKDQWTAEGSELHGHLTDETNASNNPKRLFSRNYSNQRHPSSSALHTTLRVDIHHVPKKRPSARLRATRTLTETNSAQ